MKKLIGFALVLTSFFFGSQAFAHVSYRSLDVMDPYTMSVTSDYGWADGADGTWSDSHDIRWFSFTLAAPTSVKITVSNAGPGTFTNYNGSNAVSGTFTSVGDIDPAFSVYSGLLPAAAFEGATYLGNPVYSVAANAPAGSTGLFNALGNVTMGNNSNVIGTINYLGSANNYTGTTAEVLTLLNLPAGSYSIGVGGGNVSGANGGLFAVTASIQAVPVPAAVWLYGSALAGMGVIGRRKKVTA